MQTIKISVSEEDLNPTKKKIFFKDKDTETPKPDKKKKKGPLKKILLGTLFVILFLLGTGATYAYFTAYIPYTNIKKDISELQGIFTSIKDDLDKKDASNLDAKILDAKSKLSNVEKSIKSLDSYRSIPVAAGYLNNADKGIKIAHHAFDIVDTSLPSVKKTLTAMGYKATAEELGKDLNDDQRIEALAQQIPELANTYTAIEPQVLSLIDEISELNPEFLPNSEKYDFKKIISQLKENRASFALVSDKVKDTLKVLPKLMGSEGSSKYLLLFYNENELRASGGLISAYGFMDVTKGKINDKIEANDSWYIQQYLWSNSINVGLYNPDGQAYWMNRGCGGNEMRVQDSGVYPDNIINMTTFNKYYDAVSKFEKKYGNPNKRDFPDYEAAIVLTTRFSADLLSAVEPLEMPAYKETLTSGNLAERMSYQTELANAKYPTGSKERKQFVKDVSTALKDKITKSGVDVLPKVLKAVLTGFQQKHIFMYSRDAALQEFFDKWGVTGEMDKTAKFDGDYLNVSEAQNCSLKANLWVRDTVTQDIEIKDDGTVRKHVQIDWINEAIPQKGQENIFSFDFPYRAWVRLFVPKDSKFITSKNGVYYKSQVEYDKEMGHTSIENLIKFDWRRSPQAPPAKYTLENTYELPTKFADATGYKLLIQKHPGKTNEVYNVNIKYKEQEYRSSFVLDRDKVITFKDGTVTMVNFDTRLDPIISVLDTEKKD